MQEAGVLARWQQDLNMGFKKDYQQVFTWTGIHYWKEAGYYQETTRYHLETTTPSECAAESKPTLLQSCKFLAGIH